MRRWLLKIFLHLMIKVSFFKIKNNWTKTWSFKAYEIIVYKNISNRSLIFAYLYFILVYHRARRMLRNGIKAKHLYHVVVLLL